MGPLLFVYPGVPVLEGCADGVDSHDISFVSYDEWRKTLNDGTLDIWNLCGSLKLPQSYRN